MTTETGEISIVCNHCDRDIPAQNIDLHRVHCARNLEKCKICGDMVPKKHAEEHFLNTHAPVPCSMCKETTDREAFDSHEGELCPKRIVTCEFCEFPLPAVDLAEHCLLLILLSIRKYVATARSSVINATAMLDCEKHTTIKPNVPALLSTMLNHREGSQEQQKEEMETAGGEEMGTVFLTKGFSSL